MGSITHEKWDVVLNSLLKATLSLTSRVTQRFILHGMYRTPKSLYAMAAREDQWYINCGREQGDLIHLF